MNIRSRISAIFLTVCIFISFVPEYAFAEKEKYVTIYEECFEKYNAGESFTGYFNNLFSAGEVFFEDTASSDYGIAAKITANSEKDCFWGTDYGLFGEYTGSDAIKKVYVEFDIRIDNYANANIRITDSSKIPTYFLKTDSDGGLSYAGGSANGSYAADFSRYEIKKWYNISAEFDFNRNRYNMYINDCEIVCDSDIVTPWNGIYIQDFWHWRISADKQADGCAADIYIDNLKFGVAYSTFVNEKITVDSDSNEINAECYTAEGGVMLAGVYKNDILQQIYRSDAEVCGDAYRLALSVPPEPSTVIKYFVFGGFNDLQPLKDFAEYEVYSDEDFEELLAGWAEYLTVGPDVDLSDADLKYRAEKYGAGSKIFQDDLRHNQPSLSEGGSIWGEDYNATEDMTDDYGKVFSMALGWGTMGSGYYHDEELLSDIKYAIDWLYHNVYGTAEMNGEGAWLPLGSYDWWDWFVQSPRLLMDSMIILGNALSADEIEMYMQPILYLWETMRNDLSNAEHVASRSYNMFAAGALLHDSQLINSIKPACRILMDFCTSGSGLYEDYSYLAHNNIPYNGMYGSGILIDRIANILAVTEGTPFEFPEGTMDMYASWILEAFQPLITNGGFMTMVRGRGTGGLDYVSTIPVIGSCLDMIDFVDAKYYNAFRQFILRNIPGAWRLNWAKKNLSLKRVERLKQLLNEDGAVKPYVVSRVYYNMDRVVQHRENYAVGLAMSSSRIANYESINQVNLTGWYTGDGMLYLYSPEDMDRYNDNYFKYANPYKMPGTTVDTQERQALSISRGNEYFSSEDFVGGAELDGVAVAAMNLEAFHNENESSGAGSSAGGPQPKHLCDLKAKKAWFMFDDEIVCLGASINATLGEDVITTVENRKLLGDYSVLSNDDMLLRNGSSEGNPSWAFLKNENINVKNTCGWVFPSGGNLSFNIAENTDDSGESVKFFELWLNHGTAPQGESYEYIILPDKNENETAAYAANPDIEILSNTDELQAVRENKLNVTGVVFRQSGDCGIVSVSEPMIVIVKKEGGTLHISASDPTQKIQIAKLSVKGCYKTLEADRSCTVENGSESITVSLDFSSKKGASIKFSLMEQN